MHTATNMWHLQDVVAVRTGIAGKSIPAMPGYDEAIKQLKESLTNKEEKTNGVIEQDTK